MDELLDELQKKLLSLPQKLSFKIGEASRLLGEKPSALRYWEEEFPPLKPRKFQGGLRLYFKEDMEALLIIQALLRKEKRSIEGARRAFPAFKKALFKPPKAAAPPLSLSPPAGEEKARLRQRRTRRTARALRLLKRIAQARADLERPPGFSRPPLQRPAPLSKPAARPREDHQPLLAA